MVVSNPQWQGAGSDGIIKGNQTLQAYYQIDCPVIELSSKLDTKQKVNHIDSIKEQAFRFEQLLNNRRPQRLLTLGGDCGIEPVPVAYLNALYDRLGVIWFDAHADLNLPHTSPSGNYHGMPLGILLSDTQTLPNSGVLDYHQVHYLGLRDLDPFEQETITRHKVKHQHYLDIELLLQQLKDYKHLYVHFDVDVLDPLEFSHSFYQVSNGLTIASCMDALLKLPAHFDIVGGSITVITATSLSQLKPISPILDWFGDQFVVK